ncbi:MAG: type II toxin-antitoxin system Phd/YefM family antitoxin [Thermodesulfobacteriota bacterium]|jgi:antitoxin (DNA-binding transcriptional repressor) of toxin-antitoxin stability system
MRFISVRELNTKPKKIWGQIQEEEIIITSNGKPIALLSGVTEKTLERTLQSVRRTRAFMALDEMQKKSLKLGLNNLADAEIEEEIRTVRKNRKR